MKASLFGKILSGSVVIEPLIFNFRICFLILFPRFRKLFGTFLAALVPAGSCTDNYSFDFFFIKQFQSILSRIMNVFIYVVGVCFENNLRFSVFLLKLFFSFISLPCSSFPMPNCMCSYIVFQPVSDVSTVVRQFFAAFR